jgi:hypothetical protein
VGVSSAGRTEDREANDNYPTPSWCVRRLLERVYLPGDVWGEPCSGEGGIVRAVTANQRAINWVTQDIRPEVNALYRGDFLTHPGGFSNCTTIITNPPFSLAREFIQQAARVAPKATLAFLLRVNFLGSEDRYPWLSRHMPAEIWQLPNRPSFVKGKTDSTEYGWFIWRPGLPANTRAEIALLGLTALEERKRG